MTRQELAAEIFNVSHLNGDFTLRSGIKSNEYFDKYRFEALPKLLSSIAKEMRLLIPKDAEILAGLEMGGIPIATALSLQTGLPCLFVRKKAKDYGTCQLAEGYEFNKKRVCIIEDVITTGGQVVESCQELRVRGAIIENVLCVIYRAGGKLEKLQKAGLQLSALFTMEELKNSH